MSEALETKISSIPSHHPSIILTLSPPPVKLLDKGRFRQLDCIIIIGLSSQHPKVATYEHFVAGPALDTTFYNPPPAPRCLLTGHLPGVHRIEKIQGSLGTCPVQGTWCSPSTMTSCPANDASKRLGPIKIAYIEI